MSDNVKILLVNCVPDLISQDSIESLKKKFPSRTFVIKGPEEIRDQKYCTVMVVLGTPKDRVEDIRAQSSIKSLFAAEAAVSANTQANSHEPQCFGEDDLRCQPHLIKDYSIDSLTEFLNNVIKITKAPKDSSVEQMSIGDLREKISNFDKRFTVILLDSILLRLEVMLSGEQGKMDPEGKSKKVRDFLNKSEDLLSRPSLQSETLDECISRQKAIITEVRKLEYCQGVSLSQDAIRDIFSEMAEKYVDKRSINEIQASRDIIALASSLIGEELLDESCKDLLRRNYNAQVNNTPQQSIEELMPRAVPATIDKLDTLVFNEGILNQLKAIIANFIDDKITLQVACGLIAPVLGLELNVEETQLSTSDYERMAISLGFIPKIKETESAVNELKAKKSEAANLETDKLTKANALGARLKDILMVNPEDPNNYDEYYRLQEGTNSTMKKELMALFLQIYKGKRTAPPNANIIKLFLALASQEKFNQIVPLLKARVSNRIKDRKEKTAIDHRNAQVSAMLEDQRREEQANAMIAGYNAERESIKVKPKL